MAKFRFDPDSLGRVQAKLKDYSEKMTKRATFALQSWALDTVALMQQQLIDLKAVDQGLLSAATQATPVTAVGAKLSVTVFNPLEYAVVIEWGRLAGSAPPLLPLVGWAVRHGIATSVPVNVTFDGEYAKAWAASAAILRNMGKGGGKSGGKKPIDPMTLDFLRVRLIARKIQEQGTVGRHPFSIVWDARAATFKADIAKMLQ